MKIGTVGSALVLCMVAGLGTGAHASGGSRDARSGAAHTLFAANWKSGLGAWTPRLGQWRVTGGQLTVDAGKAAILAPYHLKQGQRYALQAKLRADSGYEDFGFIVRARASGQTIAGLFTGVGRTLLGGLDSTRSVAQVADFHAFPQGFSLSSLSEKPFDPRGAWHTYRVVFRNGDVTVTADGITVLVSHGETQYGSDVRVGLISSGAALRVASFKVVSIR